MSRELHEQVATELRLLRRLVGEYRAPISRCAKRAPDTIERSAFAAMLHSFYNGVENVFKRIATALDGSVPGGRAAHRDLLDMMARAGTNRPAVISESLRDRLDPYLDFRHMFRHSYSFQLDWGKMEALVQECESVLGQFEAELNAFLAAVEKDP